MPQNAQTPTFSRGDAGVNTRSSQVAAASPAADAEITAHRGGAQRTTRPTDTISATLSTIPSASATAAGRTTPVAWTSVPARDTPAADRTGTGSRGRSPDRANPVAATATATSTEARAGIQFTR